LGVPSSPIRSRRKTSRPDSTPFDLRLPQGKIVIILRCNPWGAGGHWKVRFRCFVWENRPKSENWASLTPRSSATVRRTKTLTWTRKLPGPWTTTWSKHYRCAVHPVTCSLLWVRYLFDIFLLSDFWGKWPLKWKFSKMSCISWFIDGTPKYVSWPNLVKIGRCKVTERSHGLPIKKTRAPQDSSQPPFSTKWADRAQNSLNVVTPWPVYEYRIWSGSAAFCRTYSGKIDFSAQKVNTI